MAALESAQLSDPDIPPEETSMTRSEFDYTTRMIGTNMSNFSAWHNRGKLIPKLLDETAADDAQRKRMLDDELDWLLKAFYTDERDQSLWFYHQYLICAFSPTLAPQTMTPNLSPDTRIQYIEAEIEKLADMLDGAENPKWIFLALLQLSLVYKRVRNTWPAQAQARGEWLEWLRAKDPLRSGRWRDLAKELDA